MPEMLMTIKMQKFLMGSEFVNVGTCDLNGQPNSVPKFIIGVDDDYIYLGDYVIGMTSRNLKVNPRVSISVTDMEALEGYRINGVATILTKGKEYKKLMKEMVKQQVRHSARRIIEDVRGNKSHNNYEVSFPEKVVIFKIKCESITKISITGEVQVRKRGDKTPEVNGKIWD